MASLAVLAEQLQELVPSLQRKLERLDKRVQKLEETFTQLIQSPGQRVQVQEQTSNRYGDFGSVLSVSDGKVHKKKGVIINVKMENDGKVEKISQDFLDPAPPLAPPSPLQNLAVRMSPKACLVSSDGPLRFEEDVSVQEYSLLYGFTLYPRRLRVVGSSVIMCRPDATEISRLQLKQDGISDWQLKGHFGICLETVLGLKVYLTTNNALQKKRLRLCLENYVCPQLPVTDVKKMVGKSQTTDVLGDVAQVVRAGQKWRSKSWHAKIREHARAATAAAKKAGTLVEEAKGRASTSTDRAVAAGCTLADEAIHTPSDFVAVPLTRMRLGAESAPPGLHVDEAAVAAAKQKNQVAGSNSSQGRSLVEAAIKENAQQMEKTLEERTSGDFFSFLSFS